MSWHTPERKTEQALKLYLQTVLGYELEGVQIASRFSNVELTEPRIEIIADSCSPYEAGMQVHTGNWLITAKLIITSHYDKGVDGTAHDEIVGNILDNLIIGENGSDAAVDQINATQGEADFTVQELEIKERTNRVEEHSIVTEQEIELIISPSTL